MVSNQMDNGRFPLLDFSQSDQFRSEIWLGNHGSSFNRITERQSVWTAYFEQFRKVEIVQLQHLIQR